MSDIKITFTLSELVQINAAIDNCYGNGDWLENLDINEEGKKEEEAFYGGWSKILKAIKEHSQ